MYDSLLTGQLEDADESMEQLRDTLQASLRERVVDGGEAEAMAAREAKFYSGILRSPMAPGDTVRTDRDYFAAMTQEEYDKALKLRKARAPKPKVKPVYSSSFDYLSQAVNSAASRLDDKVDSEASQYDDEVDTQASQMDDKVDSRLSQMDDILGPIEDKADQLRAMAAKGSGLGFADNLSVIKLLEYWRARPMKELENVIEQMAKFDRFAASAIANPQAVIRRADPRELSRITRDEWKLDLSFAGYDFALPQLGKKAPTLNPVQSRVLEVVRAVAAKSALAGRNDANDFEAGKILSASRWRKPLFGLFSPSESFKDSPGRVQRIISDVDWALGLHTNRRSLLDVVGDVLAPERDSYWRDQMDFVGSWISPSSTDMFGRHQTLFSSNLAPYRTMLNIRSLFGDGPTDRIGRPTTKVVYDSDGMPVLLGSIDDRDPIYSRSMFTPNWQAVRARHLWESLIRDDPSLPFMESTRMFPSTTGVRPKVLSGYIFDPYTQMPTPILRPGFTGLIGKDGAPDLKSNVQDDHIVALKYAWEHGFEALWMRALGDPAQMARVQRAMTDFGEGRGRFANRLNLAFTQADINQRKKEKGPDAFMPSDVARTAREHAGNMFYVMGHQAVVRQLRATAVDLNGGWVDPNAFPTSLEERRSIERIIRGWDVHSDGVFGRGMDEMQKFYLSTFGMPDLSEDATYLQWRHALMLSYAGLGARSATWRLQPWNQAYLLHRKYIMPAIRRAWMRLTGDPELDQWVKPRQYSELRSGRLRPERLRSFIEEARNQNVTRTIFSNFHEVVKETRNGIVVPTFRQAVNYSMGVSNPFGAIVSSPGELFPVPSFRVPGLPGFDAFLVARLRDFWASGDPLLLDDAPDWYLRMDRTMSRKEVKSLSVKDQLSLLRSSQRRHARFLGESLGREFGETIGRYWGGDLDLRYESLVGEDLLRSIRGGAIRDFGRQHRELIESISGRERLQASSMVQDIVRVIKEGRASGAGATRIGGRAVGEIVADLVIKGLDYGARGVLTGNPWQVADNLESYPGIKVIEEMANFAASKSGQMAYVSPHIGRTTLLGHRPFALLRGFRPSIWKSKSKRRGLWFRTALGETLSSIQPVGGVGHFERLWRQAAREGGQGVRDTEAKLRALESSLRRMRSDASSLPSESFLKSHIEELERVVYFSDETSVRARLKELENALSYEESLQSQLLALRGRHEHLQRAAWGAINGQPTIDRFTEGTGKEARTRLATGNLWSDRFAAGQAPSERVSDLFARAFEAERDYNAFLADYPKTSKQIAATRRRLNKLIDKNVNVSGEFAGKLERAKIELSILKDQLEQRKRIPVVAREVLDARNSLFRQRADFDARWGDHNLPENLRVAIDPSTPLWRRAILDLQYTNPHATMFLGRVATAGNSLIGGVGRVAKAFTYDAWMETVALRPGLVGTIRAANKAGSPVSFGRALRIGGFARGVRYGGYGLSAFGGLESIARFNDAQRLAGAGFSNLSDEERADVLSYAHRSYTDVLLDNVLPVVTADPVGVAVGTFNIIGSAQVRGQLQRDRDYISEMSRAILAGQAPLVDQYKRLQEVRRIRQSSILPVDTQDDIENAVQRYASFVAATNAATNRAKQRLEAARTEKQKASAAKQMRKLMTIEAVADSGSKMRVFTSRPYPANADMNGFSARDSAFIYSHLARCPMVTVDTGRYRRNLLARQAGQMERATEALRKGVLEERALLRDTLATEATPGLSGAWVRAENTRNAREILAARDPTIQSHYKKRVRNPVAQAVADMFRPLADWERERLWELRGQAIDTIQATQRRGPK